jgi:hypothetical protein
MERNVAINNRTENVHVAELNWLVLSCIGCFPFAFLKCALACVIVFVSLCNMKGITIAARNSAPRYNPRSRLRLFRACVPAPGANTGGARGRINGYFVLLQETAKGKMLAYTFSALCVGFPSSSNQSNFVFNAVTPYPIQADKRFFTMLRKHFTWNEVANNQSRLKYTFCSNALVSSR